MASFGHKQLMHGEWKFMQHDKQSKIQLALRPKRIWHKEELKLCLLNRITEST